MSYLLAYYIYFASMFFACACIIYRFKQLDAASKILAVLICCALVNESAAYYLSKKYNSNLALYAFYCIFEFAMLCLYFNKIIDVFVRKNIGIYIGLVGIIIGILNLIFIQDVNTVNSYFLFFEGIPVIGMSLFAFFRLLITQDSLNLYNYCHFWFMSILVFFWSITFLYWGLGDYINIKFPVAARTINFSFPFVGVVTYTCFGFVFLLYPKLKSTNA